MAYEWDPDLETGYIRIDNQHKELITALNKIIKASQKGKDKEEVFKTINFLTDYTVMHFSTEEQLMKQYNYPHYLPHRSHHDQFKETVSTLTHKLNNEGPTREMIQLVTSTIGDWLVQHIKKADFHMAGYIKSRSDSGTTA